jgi:hypothetical protein
MLHRINLIPLLMAVTLARAVTWEKMSDPFSFPGTGTTQSSAGMTPRGIFACRQTPHRGGIEFAFDLPAGVTDASISICTPLGRELGSVRVMAGSRQATWADRSRSIGGGVYMARLRHGTFEQKLRFVISR